MSRRRKRRAPLGGAQMSHCDSLDSPGKSIASAKFGSTNEIATNPACALRMAPKPVPYSAAPTRVARVSKCTWNLLSRLTLMSLTLNQLALIATSSSETSNSNNNYRSQQQRLHDASWPVIMTTEQSQHFKGLHHRATANRPPGQRAQDVISILGIRYASAPIRRLRFMPPSPFNYAANQVHEARSFGPICMQRLPVDFNPEQRQLLAGLLRPARDDDAAAAAAADRPANSTVAATNKSPPADQLPLPTELQLELMERLLARRSSRRHFRQLLALEQAEDCLNLNIYVPLEATQKVDISRAPEAVGVERRRANATNLRPVLVVIHGESFDYGAGATISGAPKFAAQHNLLVVTLNFRLNLLGFPPKLRGARGGARTNLGLLDQVAALHWIQANIRSFGGSPRNVTLLGAGRAAFFVNLLMLSPLAKGLFQRAIMESGAALSPTLANTFPQQQQVAWQHLRLLATLADCATSASSLASDQQQQQQQQQAAQTSQQQQQQQQRDSEASSTGSADLARPFECLRGVSAPETLVQPLPFGLLEAGAPLGQLQLARRWHRPLELLLRNLLELDESLLPAESRRPLNELANRIIGFEESSSSAAAAAGAQVSEQQQAVSLTARQLNRLIAQLVATRHSISSQARPSDLAAASRVSELLDQLLSAIYLASNETLLVEPFAPQLESGTLLAGNQPDLISSMLQAHSPFGSHDLLIGHSSQLLPPDHALQLPASARFSAPRAPPTGAGLTDEQAIQQVSLFVRTHFRFHQQEIANSIISNYFLGDQLAAASRPPTSARSAPNGTLPSDAKQTKQVQLLHSLLEAYEDSLVRVPLVKTALVHSLKQLEAIGELFVSQQLYRLSELLAQAQGQADVSGVVKLLADEQRKLSSLEADFVHFAQNLYERAELWPLDQRGATETQVASKQPQEARSTFFYQLSAGDQLISQVRRLIAKLDKSFSENGVEMRAIASIRSNIADNLLQKLLIDQLDDGHLGLGCSLMEAHSAGSEESGHLDLLDRLRSKLCDRLAERVLVPFVASGNVNSRTRLVEDSAERASEFAAQSKLEEYQMECLQGDETTRNKQQHPDHHAVQLASASTMTDLDNSTVILVEPKVEPANCREKLDDLTLEYLTGELDAEANAAYGQRVWPIFNVFGQQLASLAGSQEPVWRADSLAEWRGTARDRFDRKIAFWANFVPTLNCSRTQPLGATALAQAHNSTLLNMNLNFDCRQGGGGARTASSLLQAIQARVRQTVAEWLSVQLAKQQQRSTSAAAAAAAAIHTLSTQNHHSLRMATGNESQLDELGAALAPAQDRHLNNKSALTAATWLPAESPASNSNWGLELRFRRADFRTLFAWPPPFGLALWLLCGALLVGSTLVAAGFVLARRMRRHQAKPADRKQETPLDATQEFPLSNGIISQVEQRVGEFITPSGPHLSQEAPRGELAAELYANYTNDQPMLSQQRASSNSLEHSSEARQLQTQQQQETILLPIISAPHYLSSQHHLAAPMGSAQASEFHLSHYNQLEPQTNSADSQLMQQQQHQHQHQQQQLALSSSSETTTITNRPQSSVSLVSGSTSTTQQTNYDTTNGSAKQHQAAAKKRVKISDPKRVPEVSYLTTRHHNQQQQQQQQQQPDDGLANTEFYFGEQANAQPAAANFCPVHRTGSASYLLHTDPALLNYQNSTPFLSNDQQQLQQQQLIHRDEPYLQVLDGTLQADFSQPEVATVGSLAGYLNLLAPQEAPDSKQGGNNHSLRYNSHQRASKRQASSQATSGLCRLYGSQTIGRS